MKITHVSSQNTWLIGPAVSQVDADLAQILLLDRLQMLMVNMPEQYDLVFVPGNLSEESDHQGTIFQILQQALQKEENTPILISVIPNLLARGLDLNKLGTVPLLLSIYS